MESQNYLGIYWRSDAATVVCLKAEGKDRNVLDCFTVVVAPDEENELSNEQRLAKLITQRCSERGLNFSDVSVALDCSMFMQHDVHSEFKDSKQIASTIRFDTEEALATDVSDVAISFKVNSADSNGSDLTVYTAQRKVLSEIIYALQSYNIDPVTIEPDVNCLAGFIENNLSYSDQMRPFFAILSDRSAYLILYPQPTSKPHIRTFLINPGQDRTALILRELPLTIALVQSDEPINCLRFYDAANSLDINLISEKMMIEAGPIDFTGCVGADTTAFDDFANVADFAIAYGAAMINCEKIESVDFRKDFMPYLGKKLKLEKMIKMISVIATGVIILLGIYFQWNLIKENGYRKDLKKRLSTEYSSVMQGKKMSSRVDPVRKLKIELSRIEAEKSGQLSLTGQASIATKLALIFQSFNSKASAIDLQINKVSISGKSISIDGSTSNRKNTLQLFEIIRKSKMGELRGQYDPKGGRDNFRLTVTPKK